MQLFWRLAGLNDSVTGSYLRKQNGELEWIRGALRTTALLPADPRDRDLDLDLDLVYEHWIEDQENYFVRCAQRQHQRVEKLERLANWLYGTGLVVSIFTIGLWGHLEHAHGVHHVLIVVMGFAPVMAALWISYADKTGRIGSINALFAPSPFYPTSTEPSNSRLRLRCNASQQLNSPQITVRQAHVTPFLRQPASRSPARIDHRAASPLVNFPISQTASLGEAPGKAAIEC